MTLPGHLESILSLARWAPSGDNAQNWRFEAIDARHLVVHGFDTRDHCIYDLEGHASQLSLGALLETIAIAASAHGLRTSWTYRPKANDTTPTFDVRFDHDPAVAPSPLLASIEKRSVQRRPMRTRPLSPDEKSALSESVGEGFELRWFETLPDRWRLARAMFRNAKLRLTLPEAFETHRRIIDWGATASIDKVPDRALGASAATLGLMKFAMSDWRRVDFFNRYLAGTVMPRVELDLVPSLACGAHAAIIARRAPSTVLDYVTVGQAVQRFWLTTTRLGLVKQPEVTPLIFGEYLRNGVTFSTAPHAVADARAIERDTQALLGDAAARTIWLARLGAGPAATARSTRLPLSALMRP